MNKLLSVTLFVLMAVVVRAPAYAQNLSLKLEPNASKVIENSYVWSLNATCKIQCDASDNTITISVANHNGSINGQSLTSGQVKSVKLHNHDSISVSAEPGTKVTLVNKGTAVVQADCLAT